jgi:exopolysaccharide biosynthesis polyprenyl glycosylphosphotransferase
MLTEGAFLQRLYLEQRRTERSRNRFVLMLLEFGSLLRGGEKEPAVAQIISALSRLTRETDSSYTDGSLIAIIFTEIGSADGKSVASALLSKVNNAVSGVLSVEEIDQINVSFHVFPNDWEEESRRPASHLRIYAAAAVANRRKRASFVIKRAMDIAGSLCAVMLFLPLFIVIPILIKVTSRGPVLFRQQRVGQCGRRFTFLKFRSMFAKNDQTVHEQYVKTLIRGEREADQQSNEQKSTYKLIQDSRITPVGRFLRRTSLDELPQFFNVIKGDMSLVGPRPPIPYEVDCYDIWHKRRLLPVKPGITGLWQVTGRSRIKFDDMVRLDLKYARTWSLWLDIRILLKTPSAVLSGDGAY